MKLQFPGHTSQRIHTIFVSNLITSHTNKLVQAVTLLICTKHDQFESHIFLLQANASLALQIIPWQLPSMSLSNHSITHCYTI